MGRQSVLCGIKWMLLCREKGENERYRSHGPAALDGGSAYAASWGILSILKLVTSEGWLMRRDIPRKPLPPQTTSFFFAAEAIECGGVSRCGKEGTKCPKLVVLMSLTPSKTIGLSRGVPAAKTSAASLDLYVANLWEMYTHLPTIPLTLSLNTDLLPVTSKNFSDEPFTS